VQTANRRQWAAICAIAGGLIAVAMTPSFATAYFLAYPGEDVLPFWFDAAQRRLGSLLTFASEQAVYNTHGRIYNAVYLLLLPLVVVLHEAHAASPVRLERRGWLVLTFGLVATTVGVAGDYWGNGIGFPVEMLGLLAMVVGVSWWGIGMVRAGVVPALWAWLMVGCGPAALASSILVGHVPSGPTLAFALVWPVVGGLVLWADRGVT
jgi:hypothetical protein